VAFAGNAIAALVSVGLSFGGSASSSRQAAIVPAALLSFLAFICSTSAPQRWGACATLLGGPMTLFYFVLVPEAVESWGGFLTLLLIPTAIFGAAFIARYLALRHTKRRPSIHGEDS
jgi:hypothetical protein